MDNEFHKTLNQNTHAVALIDTQGLITQVNEQFCRLTGYSTQQLTQFNHQDMTPERWKRFENNVIAKKVMAKGNAKYEKEIRRADGRVIPVELDVYLVRSEGGQPVGMWATIKELDDLNCELDYAAGK